jgi:hypothetical protein
MPEEGWGVPEGFTCVWIHSWIVVVSKMTFHPQICFFGKQEQFCEQGQRESS